MSNIRYGPGGGIYRIVTTTAQTGGIYFAIDCTEKPGAGPPLHIHGTEEEFFFVTEGEFTFFIDGKITKAKAGETAFVPRGKVHCFKNCTNQDARMLALFTPPEKSRATLTLVFPWRMAAFRPKPSSSNELTPSDQNSMSHRSRVLRLFEIRKGSPQ